MGKRGNVRIWYDVAMPMRDGVILYADVYRPDDGEKYPAILNRTPYLKENNCHIVEGYIHALELAGYGYNVVIQDVRGCGRSEGVHDPAGNQSEDGYDSVEWLAAQEWCDGNVGMAGESYHGYTQLAAASARPPHLKAICPFQTSWTRFPLVYSFGVPGPDASGELLENIENPEYLKKIGRADAFEQVEVPCLNLTGWLDFLRDETIYNYVHFRKEGGSKACRENSRLIVGPWNHGDKLPRVIDGIDFGSDASGDAFGITEVLKAWFDRWLKGKKTEFTEGLPIKLFILGENKWREEREWPIAGTRYVSYYLHSEGRANTLRGNGYLSLDRPALERCDQYLYDPSDPCPGSSPDPGRMLVRDQRPLEAREDVLVYTAEAFEKEVEITGPIRAELYASSDVVDTDFVCRVSVVRPDGGAYCLGSRLVRARYRNGTEPEFLQPGEVTSFAFDVGNIAVKLKAGHAIRLDVTSGLFPDADRNPNTGGKVGAGAEYRIAYQKIYHSDEYPSRLILPIIL